MAILLPSTFAKLSFEDYQSAANVARAKRWAKLQSGFKLVQSNDLPRYCWTLSSDNEVAGSDLYEHICWLLAHFECGVVLRDSHRYGIKCELSFYWGGGGTGGGPTISPELSELLQRHQIALDIGFYYETEEVNT